MRTIRAACTLLLMPNPRTLARAKPFGREAFGQIVVFTVELGVVSNTFSRPEIKSDSRHVEIGVAILNWRTPAGINEFKPLRTYPATQTINLRLAPCAALKTPYDVNLGAASDRKEDFKLGARSNPNVRVSCCIGKGLRCSEGGRGQGGE